MKTEGGSPSLRAASGIGPSKMASVFLVVLVKTKTRGANKRKLLVSCGFPLKHTNRGANSPKNEYLDVCSSQARLPRSKRDGRGTKGDVLARREKLGNEPAPSPIVSGRSWLGFDTFP